MSSFLSSPLLWAQAAAVNPAPPEIPVALRRILFWLFLYGEPGLTSPGLLGGWIMWVKVISLLSLVGWVDSWLVTAVMERSVGVGKWYDYAAVAALGLARVTVLISGLQQSEQIKPRSIAGTPIVAVLGFVAFVLFFLWVDIGI